MNWSVAEQCRIYKGIILHNILLDHLESLKFLRACGFSYELSEPVWMLIVTGFWGAEGKLVWAAIHFNHSLLSVYCSLGRISKSGLLSIYPRRWLLTSHQSFPMELSWKNGVLIICRFLERSWVDWVFLSVWQWWLCTPRWEVRPSLMAWMRPRSPTSSPAKSSWRPNSRWHLQTASVCVSRSVQSQCSVAIWTIFNQS